MNPRNLGALTALNLATGPQPRYCQLMPDHPADWRRALELLGSSPEGVTDAALLQDGFESTVIDGLVESRLATSTTEVVLAGGRPIDVRRLRLTDSGRKAMER